ncbi:unnamed protein product [Protopolystoma xenopodis]|uniref:Sushi domain-containing protein n=1 Tax=Protopolystoma xenopodis TaxID=117903 RepID=A0A3S5B2S5_9PLAT|nr:unnamed protein product [Protopolystoma xenopodis]
MSPDSESSQHTTYYNPQRRTPVNSPGGFQDHMQADECFLHFLLFLQSDPKLAVFTLLLYPLVSSPAPFSPHALHTFPSLSLHSPEGGTRVAEAAGILLPNSNRVRHGARLRVTCERGYQLAEYHMEEPECRNGSFTKISRCIPAPCLGRPPDVPNAIARFFGHAHHQLAHYTCSPGFMSVAMEQRQLRSLAAGRSPGVSTDLTQSGHRSREGGSSSPLLGQALASRTGSQWSPELVDTLRCQFGQWKTFLIWSPNLDLLNPRNTVPKLASLTLVGHFDRLR